MGSSWLGLSAGWSRHAIPAKTHHARNGNDSFSLPWAAPLREAGSISRQGRFVLGQAVTFLPFPLAGATPVPAGVVSNPLPPGEVEAMPIPARRDRYLGSARRPGEGVFAPPAPATATATSILLPPGGGGRRPGEGASATPPRPPRCRPIRPPPPAPRAASELTPRSRPPRRHDDPKGASSPR
jgi:hypothetical protein